MIIHYLKEQLNNAENIFEKISPFAKEILILESLELNKLEADLKLFYSMDSRGRKPRDPIKMLQSLLMMNLSGESSISKWVKLTRTNPVIALICGFTSDNTPGVGTYYDFFDRIENGCFKAECEHYVRASKLEKGKHLRNIKAEKSEIIKEELKTSKLVLELINNANLPNPDDLQNRLQSYFNEIAINKSIEQGLIDKNNLDISGDGSSVVSGAAENGKPSCNCRNNKIYRCDCPKYYSDRTASWGYDSYREVYFFGHRFYQLTTSVNGHDLPLAITIEPANNTDYTMSVKTIDRFLKSNTEININACSLDAGHDSIANHEYLVKKNILPVIPLKTGIKFESPDKKLSERGTPLCPANIEMKYHHRDKKRKRQCYYCPAKKEISVNGKHMFISEVDKCPQGVLCKPDGMGPVTYIYENENLRLFPEIRRQSDEYKKLMALRTGCERSNAMKKNVYKLEQTGFKRPSRFLIKLYLISMIEHATAWLIENKKKKYQNEKEILYSLLQKCL